MFTIKENSYSNLPAGTVIEVSGKDLSGIVFINQKSISAEAIERGRTEAVERAQFTLGGRSFTIMATEANLEVIAMLRDAKARRTISSIELEATEFKRPVFDEDTAEATGEFTIGKSFRFLSLTTVDDVLAHTKNEGMISQEQQKYAPKATISTSEMEKRIAANVTGSMREFLQHLQNAKPVPAPAPAAETTAE